MRRIVCNEWGEPEGLVLEETDDLVAAPGRVVVDVEAAGVNFVDALFVAGTYQIRFPPPFTPGSECAGVVSAVGKGVEGFGPGDRVIVSGGLGCYASQVSVAPGALTRLPDAIPSDVAAALVQSYCTAWFTMTRRMTVQPGEKVLVLGASGGVGLAAIDVARSLGAVPIAAASNPDRVAAAIAAGAVEGIDYGTEDLKARARELSAGGVDVVIDPVGGERTEQALRALRYGGRLAIIGFASGPIPRIPTNQILLNNRTVLGVDWGAWALNNAADQAVLLGEVLDAVVAGELAPTEPNRRPLAEAPVVLRDAIERRLQGKTVLIP